MLPLRRLLGWDEAARRAKRGLRRTIKFWCSPLPPAPFVRLAQTCSPGGISPSVSLRLTAPSSEGAKKGGAPPYGAANPPLSPLRGQLPLQGGARRRCRAPARRGYPGGAAPPGNSPGGRIELESCGAGHKVNCPRRGKRESPGGCACAAHHCLRPRRPQPPSPCEGEGRSTAQPLAALPPYGCGVPLAGKEGACPLFNYVL